PRAARTTTSLSTTATRGVRGPWRAASTTGSAVPAPHAGTYTASAWRRGAGAASAANRRGDDFRAHAHSRPRRGGRDRRRPWLSRPQAVLRRRTGRGPDA